MKKIEDMFSTTVLEEFNKYRHHITPGIFTRGAKGIHGVSHAERVLLHVLNISHSMGLDAADRRVLNCAAIFHDIGRVHDGEDETHGQSSVRRVEQHYSHVLEGRLSITDLITFKYIVEQHCIDDNKAFDNVRLYCFSREEQERAMRLLKVLKDADGLDRVRTRDLDERYLRTSQAKSMVGTAAELLKLYEI